MHLVVCVYLNRMSDKICISYTSAEIIFYCIQNFFMKTSNHNQFYTTMYCVFNRIVCDDTVEF